MKMNIQWFDSSKALPMVTVAAYGFNVEHIATVLLKGAQRIKLSLERDCKTLYIKSAED